MQETVEDARWRSRTQTQRESEPRQRESEASTPEVSALRLLQVSSQQKGNGTSTYTEYIFESTASRPRSLASRKQGAVNRHACWQYPTGGGLGTRRED
eukprot:44095-Eustigmatos_ZCMA.PRE.1